MTKPRQTKVVRTYVGSWESDGGGLHHPRVSILDKRDDELELPKVTCERPGQWHLLAKDLATELLGDALEVGMVQAKLADRFRFDVVESLPERWTMTQGEVVAHAARLQMEME